MLTEDDALEDDPFPKQLNESPSNSARTVTENWEMQTETDPPECAAEQFYRCKLLDFPGKNTFHAV